MATLEYDEVFSSFLRELTAYSIASLSDDDAEQVMIELLHKSVGKPYIYNQFASITLDDDNEYVEYELNIQVNEFVDREFALNILGKAMVLGWIDPKVVDEKAMAQMFSGKEVKWYSEATHLNSLMSLQEKVDVDLRRDIKDHGSYNNSYLGN